MNKETKDNLKLAILIFIWVFGFGSVAGYMTHILFELDIIFSLFIGMCGWLGLLLLVFWWERK